MFGPGIPRNDRVILTDVSKAGLFVSEAESARNKHADRWMAYKEEMNTQHFFPRPVTKWDRNRIRRGGWNDNRTL